MGNKRQRPKTKAAGTKKPSNALSDADVDLILDRSKKNLVAKVARGGVLTQAEVRQVEGMRAAQAPHPAAATDADERVWVTPAEFERWLPSQGLTISHKNLYKTYLGKGALYPIKRNAAGRIHREQGLELLRLVQTKQPSTMEDAMAKRAEATARAQLAKARMLERQEQLNAGTAVPLDLVNQVWSRCFVNLKNEQLSMAKALSAVLVGKSELEIETILHQRILDSHRHVAEGFMSPKAAS